MKRKKKKIQVTKWILSISFTILFARLIYASINSWNYHKTHNNNTITITPTMHLNNNV
ncbi:DUF2633 family protein [Blochmannia endosymbiont of Camponotus sp.]|uniref:DUF2633 family protein n=1 Tax=Blochmannia endosymbiont of Camponotus sp. TaxID=700220 RepID=UPI002024D517|nr:DUF2633 family protein [Blochmannia endosymbiont of Camponotus sp.]URJ23835.1 DUF2633 family protein [Blochmannia endosymbiont of Camponotus sp.]